MNLKYSFKPTFFNMSLPFIYEISDISIIVMQSSTVSRYDLLYWIPWPESEQMLNSDKTGKTQCAFYCTTAHKSWPWC